MQTLLIGEGPSADHWLSALTVCPQTVLAGCVRSTPGNGPVTRFETIGSAFKAVTVEFTVCAGAIAAAQVLEVLETGVPVPVLAIAMALPDQPGSVDPAPTVVRTLVPLVHFVALPFQIPRRIEPEGFIPKISPITSDAPLITPG